MNPAQTPLPATSLGQVSPEAIIFFFIFIAISLGITYWAARRTKSTAQYYAAGTGSPVSRTAWRSPAIT
jgi:hypothetical protein